MKKISQNYSSVLAVKPNGTLWHWGAVGQNMYSELQTLYTPTQIGIDTDWEGVIHAGGFVRDFFAKKTDGSLWARGYNSFGEFGLGTTTWTENFTEILPSSIWARFWIYYGNIFAEKHDGSLWAAGRNDYGQLGVGDKINKNVFTQVSSGIQWKEIYVVGQFSTFAITTSGELYSWGRNHNGQLGLGDTTERLVPTRIGSDTDWDIVFPNIDVIHALKTNGALYSWGISLNGVLGQGTPGSNVLSPTRIGVDFWKNIRYTNYGSNTTVFGQKTNNTLWAWGRNAFGEAGVGNKSNVNSPQQICVGLSIPNIDVDTMKFLPTSSSVHLITIDNKLFSWGLNANGQLGVGDQTERLTHTQVGTDTNWDILYPNLQNSFGDVWDFSPAFTKYARKTNGTLWSCGYGEYGYTLGRGSFTSTSSFYQVGQSDKWDILLMNDKWDGFCLGLTTDKKLYGWGMAVSGELAKPYLELYATTTPQYLLSSTAETITQKNSDSRNTVGKFLKNNNSLYAFSGIPYFSEFFNYTELGQYSYSTASLEKLQDSTTFKNIYLPDYDYPEQGYGIKNDNTLWVWGRNDFGCLGVGDTNPRKSPTQIAGTWEKVCLGTDQSFFAKNSAGNWYVAGRNDYGQLGLGNQTSPITTLTLNNNLAGFDQIVGMPYLYGFDGGYSGSNINLGIKTNGTLWGWGGNTQTILTSGAQNTIYTSPIQLDARTNWVKIFPTRYYANIIIQNSLGELYMLGDGYPTLTLINSYNWSHIAFRYGYKFVGIQQDGTLWESYDIPTDENLLQIGTDNDWAKVETGSNYAEFNIALKTDGTLWSWGYNVDGCLGLPNVPFASGYWGYADETTFVEFPTKIAIKNVQDFELTGYYSLGVIAKIPTP